MKKELFALASVALIFASCANEDLLDIKTPVAEGEGVTFGLIDGVNTRGDIKRDPADNQFKSYWNSEADKISVAYFGVEKNGSGDLDVWSGISGATRGTSLAVTDKELGAAVATYKATKTGRTGYFTSNAPSELLTFDGETEASFRVFRANKNPLVAGDLVYSSTALDEESMLLKVAAFAEQNQASAKAPFENFVMVADPIEGINSKELAVGESLDLSFERAFSGLAFSTKGYDVDAYGKLKSITVTLTTNNIAWDDASGTVDIAKKDKKGKWTLTGGNGVTTAKLTLNGSTGLEWSDDNYAFMQILPVTRTEAEKYTVVFEFANGKVTLQKSSSKSWEANNFYTIALDFTTQEYIVLGTTLIVNEDMPVLDSDGKIDGITEPSSITTFVSAVSLSSEQLAELKNKYTGITNLTLANSAADLGTNLANVTSGTKITSLTLTKATTAPIITSLAGLTTLDCPEVTSIPAGAYMGNTVISKFKFPKVVTIGANAFNGATNVAKIGCDNEDLVIGTTDANENKTSALTEIGNRALENLNLTVIDAPSLTTLSAPFGYGVTNLWTKVLLPNYTWDNEMVCAQLLNGTVLGEIDLSGVSAIGGTGISLAGKVNLAKVILSANTAVGAGAFKGAGTGISELIIENLNKITSVGDEAFSGCTSLKADIDFENTITTIGKDAFKGTGITSFDFTGITTIGEGAFQGATELEAVILDDVTALEKNVFNGANKISNMSLKSVTTIKEGALTGLKSGIVIMFNKAVTDIDAKAFHATLGNQKGTMVDPIIVNGGTPLDYTLFISNSQEGVDGNTLTWMSGENYYKATFTSIFKTF